MAHPSHSIPSKFALINGAETVTADIFAIQVIVAEDAEMIVKAAGIFDQLTANASDGNTHLANGDTLDSQKTGVNLNGTHASGLYERRSDVNTTLPCVAGNIIYGDFKSVTGTSSDRFICYIK
tara:strand:- start:4002 stop:4370 length:369 start_codon:yes stop_codon:yes gene_type:complete